MVDRDLDGPFLLSRELERTTAGWQLFRAALRRHPHAPDPFLGTFPGKRHFDEVLSYPQADPLREPLLRWLYALVDARLSVPALRLEAELLSADRHGVEEPVQALLSLDEMRGRALLDWGRGRDASGEAYLRAFARHERALGDHRLASWQRRIEVAARLEADVPPRFTPAVRDDELARSAHAALDLTREAAKAWSGLDWPGLVRGSLALGAADLWPARLDLTTMRELIGGGEVFAHVTIQGIEPVERVAPSSFLRLGARVGRACRRALARRDLPFVVAQFPGEPLGAGWGALIVLWMSSAPFARRHLGATKDQSERFARAQRIALVLQLRRLAAQALCCQAAWKGRDALAETFEQATSKLLDAPLPFPAGLGRLAVSEQTAAEWAVWLHALGQHRELVERHDEDWFDNPRAQQELRHAYEQPDPGPPAGESCAPSVDELRNLVR